MNKVRRGIGAVVIVKEGEKKTKYLVENDGIINIETEHAIFKGVRCTGMNQDSSCIRVITDHGASEIPVKSIKKIIDAKKRDYSVVTVSESI